MKLTPVSGLGAKGRACFPVESGGTRLLAHVTLEGLVVP